MKRSKIEREGERTVGGKARGLPSQVSELPQETSPSYIHKGWGQRRWSREGQNENPAEQLSPMPQDAGALKFPELSAEEGHKQRSSVRTRGPEKMAWGGGSGNTGGQPGVPTTVNLLTEALFRRSIRNTGRKTEKPPGTSPWW